MSKSKSFEEVEGIFGSWPKSKGDGIERLDADEFPDHPTDELILSYLRGSLNSDAIDSTDAGWSSRTLGAHIRLCNQCQTLAQELRRTAQAQSWWTMASEKTLAFLLTFYPSQANGFRSRLKHLGTLDTDSILNLGFGKATSPLSVWGIGNEESEEDDEGYAALSVISQVFQTIGDTGEHAISDKLHQILEGKDYPRAFKEELGDFLAS
jgi:hypothetical protein